MTSTDTIFAVASGAGRAAIAVVRISGPQAHAAVAALAGRVPRPREAALARLRDSATGETLDHALVIVFTGDRSELGEDGAELHLHGSRAVVAAVLQALAAQAGLRPAEPGEFTRRAFLNGKLDLAQIEGLADLIDAETQMQRRQAQRQLSGVLRASTAPWRVAMIEAAALVEADIDFSEEADLGVGPYAQVRRLINPVRDGLRAELAQGRAAERVRDGVRIVIAGPPNAGKSSLLNALVRREAAIVSAIAGTTRDPIEVHLDLGGCLVTLIDTAGLRESADEIERVGMMRARARAEEADLVLWLAEDGTAPPEFGVRTWRIATKTDRSAAADAVAAESVSRETFLAISTVSGQNLDTLVAHLATFAESLGTSAGAGLLARARHRDAFATALSALDHAAETAEAPAELLAEDLRAARFALDRLIGNVDVEDILGDIFSRFCIGK